jgi:uncharacterized protein (TIGR00266 family)
VQVQTRHSPGYGLARLILGPGEHARAPAGSMVATSYGVEVSAKAQGGVLKSVARAAMGGEFFASTFTAPAQGGWVEVAGTLPGDVRSVELDGGSGWCVGRGSWLACAAGIELDPKWPGFRSLLGGDSGFLLHAAGTGALVLACYGALDVVALAAGDVITVDAGHVVAYADPVRSRIRAVTQGAAQSIRTGEGLVFDFAGPGQVLTQTRNQRGLLAWLQTNGLAGRG